MRAPDSCTEWTGSVGHDGYGRVNRRGGGASPQTAHRWVYEQRHGTLPPDMQVHHLCHNRLCVNPDHLVALPPREHLAEHFGFTEEACRNGHVGELFISTSTGYRRCRECMREANRRLRRRKAAA